MLWFYVLTCDIYFDFVSRCIQLVYKFRKYLLYVPMASLFLPRERSKIFFWPEGVWYRLGKTKWPWDNQFRIGLSQPIEKMAPEIYSVEALCCWSTQFSQTKKNFKNLQCSPKLKWLYLTFKFQYIWLIFSSDKKYFMHYIIFKVCGHLFSDFLSKKIFLVKVEEKFLDFILVKSRS